MVLSNSIQTRYTIVGKQAPQNLGQLMLADVQENMEKGLFRDAFSVLFFYVYYKVGQAGDGPLGLQDALLTFVQSLKQIAANGKIIAKAISQEFVLAEKISEKALIRMNNLEKAQEVAKHMDCFYGSFEPINLSQSIERGESIEREKNVVVKDIDKFVDRCRSFLTEVCRFNDCLLHAGIDLAGVEKGVSEICSELRQIEEGCYQWVCGKSSRLSIDDDLQELYNVLLLAKLIGIARQGLQGTTTDNWVDNYQKTHNLIMSIDFQNELLFQESFDEVITQYQSMNEVDDLEVF